MLPDFSQLSADFQLTEGKYIESAEIDFRGKITSKQQFSPTIKLGKAILQIVNMEFPQISLLDYVESFAAYPSEMSNQLIPLLTAIKFIDLNNIKFDGRLAVLHHLEIFNQYKGHSLSEIFISLILKTLKDNYNVNHVLLQAFPLGMNDRQSIQKEIHRLEKIYSKAGFQTLEGQLPVQTDEYIVHYMYTTLSNNTSLQSAQNLETTC